MAERQVQDLLLRCICAIENADNPTFMHHSNAIAHAQDLRQLRGNHEHSHTLRREIADERMNLGFRADIDSLGRLIQDQNRWIRSEPAAQRNFLLITARKSTHGSVQRRSLDSESVKVFAGDASLLCKVD